MTTISFSVLHYPIINSNSCTFSITHSPQFPSIYSSSKYHFRRSLTSNSVNSSKNEVEAQADGHGSVELLRVPLHWSEPSIALQESEWLRVALHKWLDDEYCPEPTNVDISRVAADSYYKSLLQKTTDLGEILLEMASELESISYQESFHGAFSSANAAVALIADRIEQN